MVGEAYDRKHDRAYFEPVISRPSEDDSRLSFTNLIEAHVLRALRTVHDVKLSSIREAVDIAEKEFGIERLLISPDLRTSAGALFLDRYTHLLELNEGQQFTMKSVLDQYLERVRFDEAKLPFEFRPFERNPKNYGAEIVAISPFVSSRKPSSTKPLPDHTFFTDNAAERDMAMRAGVPLFFLIGDTTHEDLGRNFVQTIDRVRDFLDEHDPPFIAKVYRPSPVSAVSHGKPGRVELWLSYEDWTKIVD